MLHVYRSTKEKRNNTSEQVTENQMFDYNIVQCLYNLMQQISTHKTITYDLISPQLELVFDINVIKDPFENLSDSVLGQCVQQVYVKTDPNTLSSVKCKYVYGSKVAANRVKPGTSIPTNGHFTLENKIRMNATLQIQTKVSKQVIQSLGSITDELLKVGDVTSVKNTTAAKQNMLASFYEYMDYHNELKRQGMHAGLSYRFVEEMWDRAPPLYSLPGYSKDFTGQNLDSLLSYLLGTTSKYTFALNKHRNQAIESQILAEVANYFRTNTDNTLSPVGAEKNIQVSDENVPVSGVVILTDNLRSKLQKHIIARNTKLVNKLWVCEVTKDDFNPQQKFLTHGKIKLQASNLFVLEEKEAESSSKEKKVEFLQMGSDVFALYVVDPAYYQTETSENNRLKETVKIDFMMPLSAKFTGHSTDDLFKRDDSNPHVLPTRVFFKDAKGVTRNIGVESMIPYLTGMLDELEKFDDAIKSTSQRLSHLFKLSQATKGRENDFLREQKMRLFENLENAFPMHYFLPVKRGKRPTSDFDLDKILEDIYQKPLWIMIEGLTYEALVTNILALWTEHGFSDSIFNTNQLGRLSLSFARRRVSGVDIGVNSAQRLIVHAHKYVQRNNPKLYHWIADHGRQLKKLLIDKLNYPKQIEHYVEFVLYMINGKPLYTELFASGKYHLGLSFLLNRTEIFDTESMLLARCQGYKLFYSETVTEGHNDCKSPDYSFVTKMQTGHMPSSLGHPCIRYPHCVLSEHGTMGSELMSSDFFFDKKKPMPGYDEKVWIPIFSPCEMDETMFEDAFNPYGRSNITFDKESLDYLKPDLVNDPLTGFPGFNTMCLGLFNMNFVFHSRLLVSSLGFTMKKHVVPNRYANFWFNEFKKNAMRNSNRIMMRNLHENEVKPQEQKQNFHYTDLSEVIGGSISKFCYSHPKMVKTLMSERDNRTIPGRNVYRQQNDYLLPGSKLMENLDRGINVNDRYLL